jgi:hypothetical protein
MLKNLILLVGACLSIPAALAQQLYKSTGPDGKVVFTDRPPLEKAGKLSVMRSYVLRPVEEPKQVAAQAPAQPASAAVAIDPSATVTPAIEDIMVTVTGLYEFTRRFQSVCSTTPAASKAFSSAATKWKQRHDGYIEHQKRLLMEVVSPQKRAELQDRTNLYVEELSKRVPKNVAGRQEWCTGAVGELDGGKLDINKPAMLAVPIKPYKAK